MKPSYAFSTRFDLKETVKLWSPDGEPREGMITAVTFDMYDNVIYTVQFTVYHSFNDRKDFGMFSQDELLEMNERA